MTLLFLLLGCPQIATPTDSSDPFADDQDGDGWTVEEGDCDDADRSISPGETELWYDGVDQDCDGNDDDADGDGVAVDKDCADTDATVYPRADELCDGLDNDCDGDVDEGAEGALEAWIDRDGDGYAADNAASIVYCDAAPPVGYSSVQGDCDDADTNIAPNQLETCNGEDDDCDGSVDEDAIDAPAWFRDRDRDSWGLAGDFLRACDAPDGFVADDTDCDDLSAAVNPGEAEVCDELDNDCNGTVDDDPLDGATVYLDLDNDGHGDPSTAFTGCSTAGVATDDDCDDTDAASYPGAPEACDGADNDCDATVDNDIVFRDYYLDADGDGYGVAGAPVNDCAAPAGYAGNDDDCDDTSADVSPADRELCNGVDDDCDGTVDTDAADASAFYLDTDGDGYGLAGDSEVLCSADGDYSAEMAGDCDDGESLVYPGAPELDDNADDDCDTLVDEDFVAAGDLVITEIARQPWMGGTSTDTDAQWFEVYNNTADNLDLSGWTVTRTSGVGTDTFAIDPAAALVIPPGDVAVICATDLYDSLTDADSILSCDYTWIDPTLASTYTSTYVDNTFHLQRDEDMLSLAADTLTVDSVDWDGTWPQGAAHSITLVGTIDATANDGLANWAVDSTNVWWDGGSPHEYGTPGTAP